MIATTCTKLEVHICAWSVSPAAFVFPLVRLSSSARLKFSRPRPHGLRHLLWLARVSLPLTCMRTESTRIAPHLVGLRVEKRRRAVGIGVAVSEARRGGRHGCHFLARGPMRDTDVLVEFRESQPDQHAEEQNRASRRTLMGFAGSKRGGGPSESEAGSESGPESP